MSEPQFDPQSKLESEVANPWSHKPWWCQPWSIALTGCALIAGAWSLFGTRWPWVLLSAGASTPVLVWMGFFLLVWPRLMRSSNGLNDEL
ncbi:DUF6737 family protein [Leptolyngbya sp. FACHB-261]|uniref:DUF6737 family protein n=1 Tax=Leptolyngbya sp. FACHB-261 TaxID=2692806 RepID=UPI001686DC0D|nr:DUF6737 family protein [Leptolyngbya sp. FACHB-261]MBD2103263.1 hypothetical protein [Leptolyngbya sp. FACHB-261]